MLAINLLPQEEKDIVRMDEARRAIVLFSCGFFLAVLVGAALLLPSYFSSYFFRSELEHSLAVAERDASGRGAARAILVDAKKTRDAVGEAHGAFADRAAGADILDNFFASGEGIAVNSLFIRSGGDAVIEGRADTRDHLLAFEQRLRATELFVEVSFPLADIVRERDIRFSAKAKLKLPARL